jgi:hypothetical protein
MQHLYLIKCQQFYKIGIANDVESRLAQLSTGNPFELEVLAVYGFANAEPVERAIHQRFSNNRKRGEWFELSQSEVVVFNSICLLLGGQLANEVPTVEEEELEEAEVLAEPTDGGKWDYAAMFADGWCMEPSNSKGKRYYWVWRKRRGGKKGYIYGGRIADLPHPDIEEMRRVYRDGSKSLPLLASLETVGNV